MSDLDDIAALVSPPEAPKTLSEDEAHQIRLERLAAACYALRGSIAVIREGIATDNLSMAAEAWFELTDEERESIWVAPSRNVKGKRVQVEHAPFTTREREVIKSAEFRRAHFGADT